MEISFVFMLAAALFVVTCSASVEVDEDQRAVHRVLRRRRGRRNRNSSTRTTAPLQAVKRLNIGRFKRNIQALSNFGDRTQGTRSFSNSARWVKNQLRSYGYTVEEHKYTYQSRRRTNIYVTKAGITKPNNMYIVSAHLDGRGGGGGANDDGSGCSLVLEIARVLSSKDITLDTSVRMIFWNNEETGLNGASSYVKDRVNRQGVESPRGSGHYPEPNWLGIVTHDQILYDHGLPPQKAQIRAADADIEFQASSRFSSQSRALANALKTGNGDYAKDYPAEVTNDMCCTDSVPFQDHAPAVSVRENRRRAEIGRGAQPHWHQPTDLYRTYSEKDFLFGFNIVQTTMGTIGQLAKLKLKQ